MRVFVTIVNDKMSKLDLFHSDIVDAYCVEGASLRALESRFGINRTYIKAHLVKHGVPLKRNIRHSAQEKLDDPEWLHEAYTSTRSAAKIGDMLGVSNVTVLKYLAKHAIPVASGNEAFYRMDKREFEVELSDGRELVVANEYRSSRKTHPPRDPALRDKDYVLGLYKETRNIQILADMHGVAYSTMQNALHYHNIPIVASGNSSMQEKWLADVFHDESPVRNFKLGDIELDVYFPRHGFAVEIHGLRYHSEISGGKGRKYHQNKYERCRERGIKLLQLYEGEIATKKALIEDMVRVRIGRGKKMDARKYTVVRDLDVKEFLDANHLQGRTNYTDSVSLIDKDGTMFACMTFIKSRNKAYDFELNRFCVLSGHVVRGAFSRLLAHRPAGIIVSYSDCRYSDGDVYAKNGFEKTGESGDRYYYTKDYRGLPLNRMGFQRSKLETMLPSFDPALTEWENVRRAGYDRIWMCKTYTWILS